MKLYTTLTIFAAVLVMNAQAVIIQVDNYNFNDTNLVTANNGERLTSSTGVVALGHFGNLDDSQITALGATSISNLLTSFSQVGGDVAFSATSGYFSSTVTADFTGVDASAVGKGAFLVIGNNTSLSASTELLVYRFKDDFAGQPTFGPSSVNLVNGKGTLLIGGFGNHNLDNDNNTATPDVPAFNLVSIPVPEPSSAALLGLGGVALLLHRRK